MHSLVYTSAAYVANGGVGLLLVGGLVRASSTSFGAWTIAFFVSGLSHNRMAHIGDWSRCLWPVVFLRASKLEQSSEGTSFEEATATTSIFEVATAVSYGHHELRQSSDKVRSTDP